MPATCESGLRAAPSFEGLVNRGCIFKPRHAIFFGFNAPPTISDNMVAIWRKLLCGSHHLKGKRGLIAAFGPYAFGYDIGSAPAGFPLCAT